MPDHRVAAIQRDETRPGRPRKERSVFWSDTQDQHIEPPIADPGHKLRHRTVHDCQVVGRWPQRRPEQMPLEGVPLPVVDPGQTVYPWCGERRGLIVVLNHCLVTIGLDPARPGCGGTVVSKGTQPAAACGEMRRSRISAASTKQRQALAAADYTSSCSKTRTGILGSAPRCLPAALSIRGQSVDPLEGGHGRGWDCIFAEAGGVRSLTTALKCFQATGRAVQEGRAACP